MRKVTSCLSGAALSLMLLSNAAFGQAAIISIGSAELEPGGSATIDITLSDDGFEVAGTENRIGFPDGITVSDCEVNPDINKSATAFSGENPIAALVLSLSNTDAIPDGSVMYSCTAAVAAGTADGEYTVECLAAGASDPVGNSVDAVCENGTITVVGPPAGTITIGSASGLAGTTATVEIALSVTDGQSIAGTENAITFAAGLGAVTSGTSAATTDVQLLDCLVNPEINKGATAFAYRPTGCEAGVNCESVKALVLALDNTDAIPDGSVLYTCAAAIGADAATGTIPLTCSDFGASDPEGNPLRIECVDGEVTIEEEPTPTPTSTVTPTDSVPTETSTPSEPTPTNTSSIPTATNTPLPQPDDDSCAIVAPESTSTGWMLLMPMAALLWLRRRNR